MKHPVDVRMSAEEIEKLFGSLDRESKPRYDELTELFGDGEIGNLENQVVMDRDSFLTLIGRKN